MNFLKYEDSLVISEILKLDGLEDFFTFPENRNFHSAQDIWICSPTASLNYCVNSLNCRLYLFGVVVCHILYCPHDTVVFKLF